MEMQKLFMNQTKLREKESDFSNFTCKTYDSFISTTEYNYYYNYYSC